MIHATLERHKTGPEGTFGRLLVPEVSFSCVTGELPWRSNTPRISCIPAGEYVAHFAWSPRFRKNLYRLKAVPDRSGILIHSGNFSGDVQLGFRTDVAGCILVGTEFGQLAVGETVHLSSKVSTGSLKAKRAKQQSAVLNSREALAALHDRLAGREMLLTVSDISP